MVCLLPGNHPGVVSFLQLHVQQLNSMFAINIAFKGSRCERGGAQCLRIGEHGDNFVFDHNLHFFRILKGSVRLGQALYQGIVDTVSSLLSSIV